MPRTPYAINSYDGGAIAGGLGAPVTSSGSTIVVTGVLSNWTPLGVNGGFALALDFQNGDLEEKVWVPAGTYNWASGNVPLFNIQRGYDETFTLSHSGTALVAHVLTATDLIEANTTANAVLGQLGVSGTVLTSMGATTEWTTGGGQGATKGFVIGMSVGLG